MRLTVNYSTSSTFMQQDRTEDDIDPIEAKTEQINLTMSLIETGNIKDSTLKIRNHLKMVKK